MGQFPAIVHAVFRVRWCWLDAYPVPRPMVFMS